MQHWDSIGVRYIRERVSWGKLLRVLTREYRDTSLFASVKDYLAVEKGWFSPYLFASARRPIIPRNMKPDVVFCHGPFLVGRHCTCITADAW